MLFTKPIPYSKYCPMLGVNAIYIKNAWAISSIELNPILFDCIKNIFSKEDQKL